jgi:hypothetical protein
MTAKEVPSIVQELRQARIMNPVAVENGATVRCRPAKPRGRPLTHCLCVSRRDSTKRARFQK